MGGCADASHARQFGSVARPNRPRRVPSSYATSTERHGRCLSSRADRRARVLNDCAERGRGLDPEHRPVDGVELFRSWYASEAYQKHRHDTYAVGVSDSGVQVLDCRGSVRVEDGRHQVCALSILGELVTRFGRVLAVNCTQRAPTRPKEMPSAGELNDRCHWRPLGDVAASSSLITQRSSVQIRPPQP